MVALFAPPAGRTLGHRARDERRRARLEITHEQVSGLGARAREVGRGDRPQHDPVAVGAQGNAGGDVRAPPAEGRPVGRRVVRAVERRDQPVRARIRARKAHVAYVDVAQRVGVAGRELLAGGERDEPAVRADRRVLRPPEDCGAAVRDGAGCDVGELAGLEVLAEGGALAGQSGWIGEVRREEVGRGGLEDDVASAGGQGGIVRPGVRGLHPRGGDDLGAGPPEGAGGGSKRGKGAERAEQSEQQE